jgi:hypothetical protein
MNISSPSKRLKFIQLERELIEDFHMRLCQIIRNEVKTPFSKIYLGALNAVNYIIYILDEWKMSSFHIEMQYYDLKYKNFKQQFENKKSDSSDSSPPPPSPLPTSDDCSDTGNEEIKDQKDNKSELLPSACETAFDASVKTTSSNFSFLLDINGTLFDDILISYEKIKQDMIISISSNCLWEIKSRSVNYRKEKWMSMPLATDLYKLTLTHTAADMLISTQNILHMLKDSLALQIFSSVLKRTISQLDSLFFNDLILKTKFNEGGIAQLDFDFNKYLLPILNEFSALCNIKTESLLRK